MNFDPSQVSQMLSNAKFPMGKNDLVQLARSKGANEQVVGMLNKLPDKNFNSVQEIQSSLGSVGNIGSAIGDMGKNIGR